MSFPTIATNYRLKTGLTFLALALLVSCRPPIVLQGIGDWLRVQVTEQENGTVHFSRTSTPVGSGICEMECVFENGEILRSPCEGSTSLDCPIVTLTPEEAAKVHQTSGAPLSEEMFGVKTKKTLSYIGFYTPSKANSSTTTTYSATFKTRAFPKVFRIIQNGKVLKEESISLRLVIAVNVA